MIWWLARAGRESAPPTPPPLSAGPYLDGVASARGIGAPNQLAVELWPGLPSAGAPFPAGSSGPNLRRLCQVEVGRVQAEPLDAVRSCRTPGWRHPQHQHKHKQRQWRPQDWQRCPVSSPRGRRHPAARGLPAWATRQGTLWHSRTGVSRAACSARSQKSPGCGWRRSRAPSSTRGARAWGWLFGSGNCTSRGGHPPNQELTAPSLGPAGVVFADAGRAANFAGGEPERRSQASTQAA